IVLPGLYCVIVPLPSVVVVVVVVSETCPHANGATTAKAMVKNIFFIFPFLVLVAMAITLPAPGLIFRRRKELTTMLNSDAASAADVRQNLQPTLEASACSENFGSQPLA